MYNPLKDPLNWTLRDGYIGPEGYIDKQGHYIGYEDPEKWKEFWDTCRRNDEAAKAAAERKLWKEYEEDEEKFERARQSGKTWLHKCPECGKLFENDEPEQGYFCDACNKKVLRRLVKKWHEEGEI